MVYDSLPDWCLQGSGNIRSLLSFLRTNPGKFFTARWLAETFGFDIKYSQPTLRKAITELLLAGYPIISNNSGFGWAGSRHDLINYCDSLVVRRNGLDRRIQSVSKLLSFGLDGTDTIRPIITQEAQ